MIVIKYNSDFKVEKYRKGCVLLLRLNEHDTKFTRVFLTKSQIKFLNSVINGFKKEKKEEKKEKNMFGY